MSARLKASGIAKVSCNLHPYLIWCRKIDLTLNFVDIEDLEESVDNLQECENMQELFMTGNPCTQWEGYKDYVIARVSQLKRLDGEDISKSQRLEARQKLKMWQEKLKIAAAENLEKKKNIPPEEYAQMYTKESRVQQYKEMQEQKRQEEERAK